MPLATATSVDIAQYLQIGDPLGALAAIIGTGQVSFMTLQGGNQTGMTAGQFVIVADTDSPITLPTSPVDGDWAIICNTTHGKILVKPNPNRVAGFATNAAMGVTP